MQLGQAAGTAAAIALDQGLDLPAVPPGVLQARLREQHVQLEWPVPPGLTAWLQDESAIAWSAAP